MGVAMEIVFLGAAGTVTGSKYLVRAAGAQILVDCGMFQGAKRWRLENWAPLTFDAADIDAVLLTHAHLDHVGLLPVVVRAGMRAPVYCTAATRDLSEVVLQDSAHIQESDAEHANRHGYSKHLPALPLYTQDDAAAALALYRTVHLGEWLDVAPGVRARFRGAGHILGAASVEIHAEGRRLIFSGDLGRPHDTLQPPPERARAADSLVIESTYGDRRHSDADPAIALADAIIRIAGRGGVALIPSFAVERAQRLIYELYLMKQAGRIPNIPIYLDSPMARLASQVFLHHASELRTTPGDFWNALSATEIVETVAESKRIDRMNYPRVIISSSGMATGGRVLHHLKALAPEPRNGIILAGFQAPGTRGAALRNGAKELKIHGGYVAVRAEVFSIDGFSAHGDCDELLAWMAGMPDPPRTCLVTHGEPVAAAALRERIADRFGIRAHAPSYGEVVSLPGVLVDTDATPIPGG